MPLLIKICGLNTPEAMAAALGAGADMVGLVFYPRSPRHVAFATARALADQARGRARIVALVVDADDDFLRDMIGEVRPDVLQLHGGEAPERVDTVRAMTGLPVMKALGVAEAADLARLPAYAAVSDLILLDAKPPKQAGALPGGNGLAFDWHLVAGLDPGRPVMLSGGLNPDNVAEAIRLTGLSGVDVSSGVESAPGAKDPARIAAFVAQARAAQRAEPRT